MEAVMAVLGKPKGDWKKEMADPKFIKQIVELDKNNLSDRTIKAIECYTK